MSIQNMKSVHDVCLVWCHLSFQPPHPPQQVVSHLMERAGETAGEKFEGVKVICYDSTGWVRKNFQAKVDKHNEVGLGRVYRGS